MFKAQESPLQYGIMFAESEQQSTEIRWYEFRDERDQAVTYLLTTGFLEIKSPLSRTARPARPYAFSIVDGSETFYQRVSR